MRVRKSIFQDLGQNYPGSRLEDYLPSGGSGPFRAVVIFPNADFRGHPAEPPFGKVGSIRKSVEYIHRNAHRPFRLEELLKICSMPKRSFEREFVANIGIDPHSFINRCRIERACMLLNGQSCHLIKDIASMSGFSSVNYFQKVFRRLMGVSPTAYQRKNRKRSSWKRDGTGKVEGIGNTGASAY